MLPGPFIIRECPECSKTFTEMTMASGNTFGAKLWSDMRFDAPMMMKTHQCGVCPECDAFMWLKKTTEIDRIQWEDLKSSKYSESKLYEFPTIDNYINALKDSSLNIHDELYIRVELLHTLNDHFRRGIPLPNLSEFSKENKLRLIELLDDSDDNRLLKAELHRELGDFPSAIAILKGDFRADRRWVVDALSKLCEDKNVDVVCLEKDS
jgi:hypothetical protein